MHRRYALTLAALLLGAHAHGCSRSGLGGECTPAASILSGDTSISLAAVDDANVYWFRTGRQAALRAAPRCGGTPWTVTAASAWHAVAVGGGQLYFVDGAGSIRATPRSGGVPVLVAQAAAPIAMVVQGGVLLWMADDGFHAWPPGGVAVAPLALGPPRFAQFGHPISFVADDHALYWLASTEGAAPPSLLRFGRDDGGVAVLVAGGARLGAPAGSLSNGSAAELLFAGWGGDVQAVPRLGGAVRTVAAYQAPDAIAASLGFAWWTSAASAAGSGMTLRRMALGGGEVEAAGGPSHPASPIGDGDAVWIDDGKDLFRISD